MTIGLNDLKATMRTGGEVGMNRMPDREKVIKAIEICYSRKYSCDECEYFHTEECNDELMGDALELLKEQEDQEYVEPIPTPTDSSGWFFKCNKCNNPINWKDKFCSMCGKAVKWG